MLLVALTSIAAGVTTAGLFALGGHPYEAFSLLPIVGSAGGLLAGIALTVIRPRISLRIIVPPIVRNSIGDRLKDIYTGVLSEPLPDRLAGLAGRL